MNNIQVHFFQHAADEGFGNCKDYLHSLGAQLSSTEFFALPSLFDIELDALPEIDDVDLLIVMGSLLQLQDELYYPWLKTEKRWLRRYLASKKPLIAVGVGAQVLAQSLGAIASDRKLMVCGWQQVYAYADRVQRVAHFQMPQQTQVLQWYQQGYALPRGAIALAYSHDYHHQAFQIEQHVLAFQFHPEITPQRYQSLCEEQSQQLKDNAAQSLSSLECKQVNHQVHRQLNDQVNDQLSHQVNRQVNDQVNDQVSHQDALAQDDHQAVLMGCRQGALLLQRAIDYVLSYSRQKHVKC
ncbi:hypothetical protein BFG52_02065 [Acinetobacter larvae]|uniref:Glutamine amidotransferase domain-containing protein n=2 Tax=Acinetobacter larvae TaxID=1789224 RepID=A0A1B2LWD5_9GAMM|nr:hypothetical protein BFG52_02065 [Acinetobacter larvae]